MCTVSHWSMWGTRSSNRADVRLGKECQSSTTPNASGAPIISARRNVTTGAEPEGLERRRAIQGNVETPESAE